MKAEHSRKSCAGLVAAVLVATVFTAGCDMELLLDSGKRAWTEDVRLDDGTVIRVERTVKFLASNSWSGDAYSMRERDATLAFTGELAGLPVWHVPRMALVLYKDRANNQWVIVATTTSCEVWAQAGKPKPSYWEYRLTGSAWQEVPLSAASIGRKNNLFTDYDQIRRRPWSFHIAAEDVERQNSNRMRGRKYKEVWGDPEMYGCGQGDPGKVR